MLYPDYTDVAFLTIQLDKIKADMPAMWGKMSAQHVVEHLSLITKLSFSEMEIPLEIPEEKVAKARLFLFSEEPMPRNFKLKVLGDEPPSLYFASIDEAKQSLLKMMHDFNAYYEKNPLATRNHPTFGKCSYSDWKRIHSKHFTHHFLQFGIE